MTAAYMQILIHTMNNSLFPNADPSAVAWTKPPPEIVTVQCLLYASLATSLFASFLAMLGKQWISRYLRNHGGSAADKSRDRQQKLDGLEKWYFVLVIEGLPVMLQFALLLLGCALTRYLWTISPTVARLILAFTILGLASYILFTLAATFSYTCPYQTPSSILIRNFIRYTVRSDSASAHLLQTCIASLSSTYFLCVKYLKGILSRLRSAAQGIAGGSGHTAVPHWETPEIPLAVVTAPVQIFEGVRVDWDGCRIDARCIAWLLHSTTDIDVIYSTVRFASDTVWYPQIAGALSPHILANLFFDCLVDGRVIPDRLEHASTIGMALASVISIQLSVEPEDKDLEELCERIHHKVQWVLSAGPMVALVVNVLKSVAEIPFPVRAGQPMTWVTLETTPEHLPTSWKLWLSRVMVQMLWRWRRVQDPTIILPFQIEPVCRRLMADGDHALTILKTNCVLTMAISLGLSVNIHGLYAPNNKCVLRLICHGIL